MPWASVASLRASLSALFLVLALAPSPLRAEQEAPAALDQALEEAGWSLLKLPGVDPTRFSEAADGSIRIEAEDSNALIYQTIDQADRHKRYLSWRWRVEQAASPTDILTDEGDDRPLSLHIWFSGDPEERNFFDRIVDSLAEAIVGLPLSGRILTYSWGGIGPPGAVIANPHVPENGILTVLRGGDAPQGQWLREEIDIEADFRRAFGEAPEGQMFIGLSADSEDTGETSVGYIDALRFSDQPALNQ